MAAISSSETALHAFGLGCVGQPVEPGFLGVLGELAQPLVLLDVDHDGLLLSAPGDDRRGLLPPGTVDDVGEVASDLGHGFDHRFTHATNAADVHLIGSRSRTPPRPSCPGRPAVGASPSGRRARRPGGGPGRFRRRRGPPAGIRMAAAGPAPPGVGDLDANGDGTGPDGQERETEVEVPARDVAVQHGVRRQLGDDQHDRVVVVGAVRKAPGVQADGGEVAGETGSARGGGEAHREGAGHRNEAR